tara:strand:+ start:240 stop:476 length:237 start_codon:yes stop_codon:yes gene_type:complete
MSDLVKTIKFGFVSYVEIDAEDVAYEYVGDDVFHVEECTGTEWLTFDEEKRKSFEPIMDTVFDRLGIKCTDGIRGIDV